jgi:hypothetical protein
MFLLTLLKISIIFTIGFSKNPFIKKGYNYKQKFTIFIDKFCNNKKTKIIEFPVVDNSPEKWEEGEVPWDLKDDTSTETKKTISTDPISPENVSFLFI